MPAGSSAGSLAASFYMLAASFYMLAASFYMLGRKAAGSIPCETLFPPQRSA